MSGDFRLGRMAVITKADHDEPVHGRMCVLPHLNVLTLYILVYATERNILISEHPDIAQLVDILLFKREIPIMLTLSI